MYVASFAVLSSYAETASGFLVVCMPVLPKLFIRMKNRISTGGPSKESSSGERIANKPEQHKSWWHVSVTQDEEKGSARSSSQSESCWTHRLVLGSGWFRWSPKAFLIVLLMKCNRVLYSFPATLILDSLVSWSTFVSHTVLNRWGEKTYCLPALPLPCNVNMFWTRCCWE